GATCLICVCAQLLPWSPAFAIQQRLSHDRNASRSVGVAFAPASGKFRDPSGVSHVSRGEDVALLALPLAISGLPGDTLLKMDRARTRWIGSEPRSENLVGLGSGENLESDRATAAGRYQHLRLPGNA